MIVKKVATTGNKQKFDLMDPLSLEDFLWFSHGSHFS